MGRAGIQIYSLRELANQDLRAAIQLIKDAGYAGIEFDAGMLNRARPHQVKEWMDDANLSVIGLTLLMPELNTILDPMLNYALYTGAEWLVMPWIDERIRKTIKDYENVALKLNQAGLQAAGQGVRFAYHIHGYEFVDLGGKCGFDVLMERLDPDCVELQVDTFWVASGGIDICEFSEIYIDRIGSFHLKDAASLIPLTDIEVGEGILDIQNIVNLGIEHDIEWFIVEQEATTRTIFDSINKSCLNLQQMLINAQKMKT
jgi:sugar phosphate isomerase/epimerase